METKTETAAPVEKKARVPRDPNAPAKSFGTTLTDAKKNQLRFRADQKKGGWVTYVEHVTIAKDGTKDKTRGASSRHESREAAEKELNSGVAVAVKDGWQKVSGGGGFRSQPDKFTLAELPKPRNK
jgi:hypothetical protein